MDLDEYPLWIEVDLDALEHNVRMVKRLLDPGVELMAVVKGDGYGHGATWVARAALGAGASCLGVTTVAEAVELRRGGIESPILVFSNIVPRQALAIVRHRLKPTLWSVETARAVADCARRQGEKIPVHVKVDCGMNRVGVEPARLESFVDQLGRLEGISLEGVYTHLGSAHGSSRRRLEAEFALFASALRVLEKKGVELRYRHAANSEALIKLPRSRLDMVRVGNLLYGVAFSTRCGLELRATSRARARIIRLREVPKGTGIGYGPDYRTKREARIATVPVGVVDGLGLHFHNRHRGLAGLRAAFKQVAMALGISGYVRADDDEFLTVNGNNAPVVGRICMQQCMADVTRLPGVREGEVVEVNLPPLFASAWVPRVYLRDGLPVAVRTITSLVETAGATGADAT